MNIQSQYSIVRYNGKQTFSLTTPPTSRTTVNGVTIVNPDYIKYYEFLKTIEKVYDTQTSPKGNIPTFWTISSGNQYIPSTDSTLSGLAPGSTYYFVARSSAELPISVPLISGSLVENIIVGGISGCSGVNYNCCPTFSSFGSVGLNSPDITLTDNNYHYMSVGLDNLIPNTSYFYNFSCLNSNWPSFINPKSGIYTPSTSSGNIESVFHFGLSLDETNSLPYTYDLYSSVKDKFSLLNIFVSGLTSSSNCKPINKSLSIRCYDCLPNTDCPNVIFADSPSLVLNSDCCSSNQTLSVNVTNAVPGREYEYSFGVSSGISLTSVSTGIAVFGSTGAGKINTTFNVYNTSVGILTISLTDTYSNKTVMDFLSTACGQCINTGGVDTPVFEIGPVSTHNIDISQQESYLLDKINFANGSWFVPCSDSVGGDYYLKSSDAIVWNKYLTLGEPGIWSNFVGGNTNKYVVFNQTTRKVKYSTDGETWLASSLSSVSNPLGYELFFANNRFWLFRNGYGTNVYSSDGNTWTTGNSATGGGALLNSTLVWKNLYYLNNNLILIGSNASSTWIFISSDNGSTWSSVASLDGTNINYIVAGILLNEKSVYFADGNYYVGLSDKLIRSSNGTAWVTVHNPSQTIRSASYNNSKTILDIALNTTAKFIISDDTTNFIVRYPSETYTNGCTYNINNKFLSVSSNGTMYGHLDGVTLYKIPTNLSSTATWNNNNVLFNNNKIVITNNASICSFDIA